MMDFLLPEQFSLELSELSATQWRKQRYLEKVTTSVTSYLFLSEVFIHVLLLPFQFFSVLEIKNISHSNQVKYILKQIALCYLKVKSFKISVKNLFEICFLGRDGVTTTFFIWIGKAQILLALFFLFSLSLFLYKKLLYNIPIFL